MSSTSRVPPWEDLMLLAGEWGGELGRPKADGRRPMDCLPPPLGRQERRYDPWQDIHDPIPEPNLVPSGLPILRDSVPSLIDWLLLTVTARLPLSYSLPSLRFLLPRLWAQGRSSTRNTIDHTQNKRAESFSLSPLTTKHKTITTEK